VLIACKASPVSACGNATEGAGAEGDDVDNGTIVLDTGVAVERGGNLSSCSVGRSYPLKVVLGVEIEEEMDPSSRSSSNTFRDSVATVAMVIPASDSFSFPEKDSLYTLY
jgi:hypothetical protein